MAKSDFQVISPLQHDPNRVGTRRGGGRTNWDDSIQRFTAGCFEFVCFVSNGTEAKCRGWGKGLILQNDLTIRVTSFWKLSRVWVPIEVHDDRGLRRHM